MHLDLLLEADLSVFDAEAWVASLPVVEDPGKRRGEVIAWLRCAAFARTQHPDYEPPESQEETDRNYLPRIANIQPWKSALPAHMRGELPVTFV